MLFALRNRFGSIRLAALQFLSLGGIGIVWPYVNVYLTDQGFSGTLIGTLGSAGAFLSLILTPLLNQIADRLGLHRRLFMMYMGGFALANIIFAIAPHQLLLVIAVLLSRLTISPSLTLGMQLTITFLMSRGKAILGRLRSFASLGFTLASLLAGQLFALGGYPMLFLGRGLRRLAHHADGNGVHSQVKERRRRLRTGRATAQSRLLCHGRQPVLRRHGHLQYVQLHLHPLQSEPGRAIGAYRLVGGADGRGGIPLLLL